MNDLDRLREAAWHFIPKEVQDLATEMCAGAAREAKRRGLELAIGDDVILFRSAMCDYLHACIRATKDREQRRSMN